MYEFFIIIIMIIVVTLLGDFRFTYSHVVSFLGSKLRKKPWHSHQSMIQGKIVATYSGFKLVC